MAKPRIAVLFPAFLGGGAESVALWILEALKDRYDLTLFTFSSMDFADSDRYYGTHLVGEPISVLSPWHHIPAYILRSHSLFGLRQHLMMRFFGSVATTYDLAISAFNEMDLRNPGIQYVYFPFFGVGAQEARKHGQYPDSPIRRVYHRACRLLSGFSQQRMKDNITVTLSDAVARIIRDVYGIESRIIYPPVKSSFAPVPWKERENGFIFVGRLVPDKKAETAIEIVRQIREKGHDVHLHIVSGSGDPKYANSIFQLQNIHASWVTIEQDISNESLADLLSHHRYGIHTKQWEEFGIVVAEMVNAGCIPFVPSSGGPQEIVGYHPHLTFRDEAEAVQHMHHVLCDPTLQGDIRSHLSARACVFSEERFMGEFRALVDSVLESRTGSV